MVRRSDAVVKSFHGRSRQDIPALEMTMDEGRGLDSAPPQELKVFISRRDSTCDECREALGRQAWIVLAGQDKAMCLACADLDHLAFLPSGDTAVTRRAKKHSSLFAVVLKWSRARRRYERQGLLVEEAALAAAEEACLADADARQRQRDRNSLRRQELDEQYVLRFATQIRALYPNCPPDRERVIAEHACRKYSGRVGRSAGAKDLEEDKIRLAVIAHLRHTETSYDQLLGSGWNRLDARREVSVHVDRALAKWSSSNPELP
jgi:hypothetical protein